MEGKTSGDMFCIFQLFFLKEKKKEKSSASNNYGTPCFYIYGNLIQCVGALKGTFYLTPTSFIARLEESIPLDALCKDINIFL